MVGRARLAGHAGHRFHVSEAGADLLRLLRRIPGVTRKPETERAGAIEGNIPPAAASSAQCSADAVSRRLQLACQGDVSAFSELYAQTWPRVLGMTCRVLRDPAQAAEVAQDVFIDVWSQRAVYDPARGTAIGWLLMLAHRRAVDRVRTTQASNVRDHRHAAVTLDRNYDHTSEQAHARMDAAEVASMLTTLTPLQRQAVSLAFLGGYTHREIAALLNLPLGTVKSRISDGLADLRRHASSAYPPRPEQPSPGNRARVIQPRRMSRAPADRRAPGQVW